MNNSKNIQLICTDVDHTILNDKQELTTYTQDVLMKLQKRGIKVIVATGKNLTSTRNVVDPLQMDDPLIFANGSLVQYRDESILVEHTLPRKVLERIIQLGEQQNMNMLLYYPDRTIGRKNDSHTSSLAKYGGPRPILIDDWRELDEELESALKIVFIDIEDPKRLETMKEVLGKELPEMIDTFISLPILLEVQPAGISKGKSLEEVAKMLSIPRDAIIAFGDGDNDIEMLRYAGIGAAVANASPALLSIADVQIASNNENGPAKFLQEYFNLQ